MDWIFGMDGGGTSTRLRLESLDGALLARVEGSGTNPNSNPRASVVATIRELFDRALREAGVSPGDCRAGFAGAAGIDRDEDRRPFAELLRGAAGLSCPVEAGNDAEPALAGALGEVEGLLLIAGTGAIAYGRSRDGSSARAGGWGHVLGDEGSAYRLGFDALARGLRSAEGRDLPTGLLEAGLAHFGLAAPADLLPFVYGAFDKARIARFARVVGDYRDRGDELAIDLFATAARELVALVRSVDGRIGPLLARRRLALRGGLIEGDRKLREAVEAGIRAAMPGLEIVRPVADAASGACLLARAVAGLPAASLRGGAAGPPGPAERAGA